MLVDDSTWNKLSGDIRFADFGSVKMCPIVSPIHLIAMKFHAAKQEDRGNNYKDLNDIAEIMLSQNIVFEDLEKSDIITKYGTEEAVNTVRKIIKSRQ